MVTGIDHAGVASTLPACGMPLARWLVGVFRLVLEVPMCAVLHPRKPRLLRCTVAVQLIGGEHPRHVRQPFQPQTAKRLRSISHRLSNVEGGVHGHEKALKRLASLQVMSPATARGHAASPPDVTRDKV
jgi:hypothetical protein